MIRETANALVACVVTFILCAVVYPAAVWGLGQLAFPREAEGSLVYGRDRTVIGSELIAQPFASEKYVFPRPSAVDYKADATGGSNLGTKNPDLRKKVAERAEALKATEEAPAPVDLVTASGGGVDPHVSPEAAYYQAARVAAARGVTVGRVKALIARHVERSGAILGAPPRVNVLRLNLSLDAEVPAPRSAGQGAAAGVPEPTPVEAAGPAAAPPGPAAPGVAEGIASRVVEIASRLEGLGRQLDANTRNDAADRLTPDAVKALDERLSRVAEGTSRIPILVKRVEALDGRMKAADESVRRLQGELREARDALKALGRPAARPAAPAARRGTGAGSN